MHLYYLPPNYPYYRALAQFVLSHFTSNIHQLKIVLPTGQDCQYFQNLLIDESNQSVSVLPNVVPLYSLIAEGEFTYDLPLAAHTDLSARQLEQVGIMAHILIRILDDLSVASAIELAPQILKVVEELKLSKIKPEDLTELDCFNESQHHINSLHLVLDIYSMWEVELKKLAITDNADLLQQLFVYQVEALKRNDTQKILLAGFAGENITERDFIKNIAQSEGGYYVLPPVSLENKIIPEPIQLLCNHLEIDVNLIKLLPHNVSPMIKGNYDQWFEKGENSEKIQAENITLSLFDNLEDEIEHIVNNLSSDKTTAILAPNSTSAEEVRVILAKRQITYLDRIPIRFSTTNQFSLVKLVAEDLAINGFNIVSFTNICKHPYLRSDELMLLDHQLRKKQHGITLQYVIDQALELGLKQIVHYLQRKEFLQKKNYSFSKIVDEYLALAASLSIQIYSGAAGKKLSEAIIYIAKLSLDTRLSLEEYSDLFLSLTSNLTYLAHDDEMKENVNVTLLPAEGAALYHYDTTYVLECNQDAFFSVTGQDPWLGNMLRDTLGLKNYRSETDKYNYLFYLLLHKSRLHLMRTQYFLGESLLESRLLSNLKSIFEMKLEHFVPSASQDIEYQEVSEEMPIVHLPDKISATSVERLIKDPYSFWQQNILGLRSLDMLDHEDNVRGFGIFVHKVIELFTNNNFNKNPQDRWEQISELTMQEMHLPASIIALWRPKIAKIYLLIAQFLRSRQEDIAQVYTEYSGQIEIALGKEQRRITLTSIADRIEVDKQGLVTIIDFKTGSIPTKDEVLRGASVQMLVEAIILAGNGFNGISYNGGEIRCIYVRIASQLEAPEYLEVILNAEDIKQHISGLKTLLEYYDGADLSFYQPLL